MASGKRIAVIVRACEAGKQAEALRMSLGLTVLHSVDVFVLDNRLLPEGDVSFTLEMMKEMGMGLYSNSPVNEMACYLAMEEIAVKVLEYDSVLTY
jgi:hypothetical protein